MKADALLEHKHVRRGGTSYDVPRAVADAAASVKRVHNRKLLSDAEAYQKATFHRGNALTQIRTAIRRAGIGKIPLKTAMPDKESDPSTRNLVGSLLSLPALFVPKRLYEEEVGDALEVIAALQRHSAPRWAIWTKVASTIFWVLVNAVRESMAALLGKKKGGG